MSLAADILDAMVAAGASAEVIAAAVKADQAAEEAKRNEQRAKAAARQRAKRERDAMSRDVTVTGRDVRVTERDPAPPVSPSNGFPTPLPITTPSTPPPTDLVARTREPEDGWPKDAFEQFWRTYPHRIAKQAAVSAFAKARRSGVPFDRLMAALGRYITDKPHDRPWCNPATWLNGHRWEDEPATEARAGPASNFGRPLTPNELQKQKSDDAIAKLKAFNERVRASHDRGGTDSGVDQREDQLQRTGSLFGGRDGASSDVPEADHREVDVSRERSAGEVQVLAFDRRNQRYA